MVRHKVKSGNLFLCLVMIVFAVGPGYAQTDDVRKELEAVFAKLDQAELKKDFSYWKSLETADYREKSKDGSVRDRATADARIEKMLPLIKEVREQASNIETVRPGDAKDEYVVEARSNFALTMAAKGYPRELKGSELTRSIWVRTPEGWKIKYREELDSSVDLGAKGNLAQRLQSQYVLSKVSGNDITPGTVLALQKPGLTGCSKFALTNNYKDSRIKQSFGSGLAAAMMGSDNSPTRSFDVGEALYLVKISVKDNSVDFIVITREVYDGAHYGASVSFQFPKGYLASADPAKVQETIAELFKVDEGQNAAGSNAQGSEAAPPPIAAPAAPPEQPQQAAQPQSIELGQTTEQVVATLGQPSKIVKLGDKQIYVYKDLKVTFINGKVSNVE